MPDSKTLGVVGVLGAGVFTLIVITLTVRQWSYLQGRGWHPIRSSDVPYPSALALGPGGWLQVVNFGILGLALLAIAAGLWQAPGQRPTLAIWLLVVAGIAGLALMAPTDGSLSSVRTWHGAVHVGAFFTLLIAIVLAAASLGLAGPDAPPWAGLRVASIGVAIIVVALTVISFVVPSVGGLASVASIAAMLVWLAMVGAALASTR
jgi:Protein of unknown function (DUF998)